MFRLALLILILSTQALAAQTRESGRFATKRADIQVIVRGTTTLDPDVVAEMSGVRGKPGISETEIRRRLENSGLFSYVQVIRLKNTIYIRVRQKFTFFILPYVSKDFTGTYYSLAGGKQIVLGEDALMAGRYQFGTSDHEGGFLIRDQAVLGGPFILEVGFGYEDALHWIYEGRTIVSQTENKFHGGHLKVGYRFYPYLDCSLINYVEQHNFEEVNGVFHSGLQWSSMLEVNYDHLYRQEGLSNGFSIKWDMEETPGVSDFHFWRTKLSPTFVLFRHDPLNWVLRGEASYSPSLPRYQKNELGGSDLRGYEPEQFRVNYYGILQNDLFLSSSKFWKINLRSFAFVDWGFVEGSGRPAAGGGIQIYPRRIAISAFQLYTGYGFNPSGWTVAFSLGASFQ